MTLTNEPHDTSLDLDPWVGQRSATFRFKLTDGVTGEPLGTLDPVTDTSATLTHDTTSTIKRRLNLTLTATDTARVDKIRHRILPFMVIGGVERPLGRYMFVDQTRLRTTTGLESNVTLVDEMFIIDQALTTGFAPHVVVDLGLEYVYLTEPIHTTIERLLTRFPLVTQTNVEPSPFVSVGSWSAGTSGAKVLEDLALTGVYLSPWFDHDGTLQLRRFVDPASAIPDLDLDDSRRVFRDSIAETDDLLDAPNRIVVVSNGALGTTETPIIGTFDVPASAPHSIQNRGFIISDIRDMQVNTTEQATAVARNLGERQLVVERVELSTPPDPRHDSYDIIRWNGENWLEIGWTMQLREGGDMRHVMRRVYGG